jgi:4-hydroxy-tetrahydrodipicolinate synthase
MDHQLLLQRLSGVFPAIPTTLTPDEDVDAAAQRRVVEFLLEAGVHGLWVLGGAGEGAVLTEATRCHALEAIAKAVDGRVPIVAGVGEASTKRTVERIRAFDGLGADAVSITAPYFFMHTQQDLRLHIETILGATSLPIMLYHLPYNTKVSYGLELIQEFARHERIVGIKDAGLNFSFTLELLRTCQTSKFRVFQGCEDLMAASLLMGAAGVIAMVPAFAPHLACRLYEEAVAGNREAAMALQSDVNDLLHLLGSTDASAIAAVKLALSLRGLCGTTIAKPLSPLSGEQAQTIRDGLAEKGLLGRTPA